MTKVYEQLMNSNINEFINWINSKNINKRIYLTKHSNYNIVFNIPVKISFSDQQRAITEFGGDIKNIYKDFKTFMKNSNNKNIKLFIDDSTSIFVYETMDELHEFIKLIKNNDSSSKLVN